MGLSSALMNLLSSLVAPGDFEFAARSLCTKPECFAIPSKNKFGQGPVL